LLLRGADDVAGLALSQKIQVVLADHAPAEWSETASTAQRVLPCKG
jgi:hypothetical protein